MTVPTSPRRLPARSGIPPVRLSVEPGMIRVLHGIQWGLLSLLICASLLSGWMWWEKRAMDEEATRYTVAAARTDIVNQQFNAQLEQNRLTLSTAQMAEIQQDARFINQLADKRGFLWTQLLADLEEALPAGISIGTIHRDVKASTITIEGHATGMDTLKTLMRALQTRPAFRQPVLHQHQLMNSSHHDGEGDREAAGVKFSVTVSYRGSFTKAGRDDVS